MKNRAVFFFALILSAAALFCSCGDISADGMAVINESTDSIQKDVDSVPLYAENERNSHETDAVEENKNDFKVDFVKEELEIFDESEKLLLLTGQFIYPVISIPENPEAEASINGYFASEKEKYDREAERMHADSLELLGNFQSDYWNTFVFDKKYSLEFADGQLLSFLCHTDIYLGGAHPTPDETGLVFDMSKGNLLSTVDFFSDVEAFRAYALPIIKAEVEKDEPFAGYESVLPDLIDDGTFYLGKTGLNFICNVYVLFPYVAGIKYYTFSFDDIAGFLDYTISESVNFSRFYSFDMDSEDGEDVLGYFDTREFSCPYDETDTCVINGDERHCGYIVPKNAGSDIVIEHVLYDDDGAEIGSEVYKSFKNTEEDFCLKITCPMDEKKPYYRAVIIFDEEKASFDIIYGAEADKPVKPIR